MVSGDQRSRSEARALAPVQALGLVQGCHHGHQRLGQVELAPVHVLLKLDLQVAQHPQLSGQRESQDSPAGGRGELGCFGSGPYLGVVGVSRELLAQVLQDL